MRKTTNSKRESTQKQRKRRIAQVIFSMPLVADIHLLNSNRRGFQMALAMAAPVGHNLMDHHKGLSISEVLKV
jgi:hypothetical protein